MTFTQMLRLVRRHLALLAALGVLGAGLGALSAARSGVVHQASGQVMVSPAAPEKGRELTELSTFVQSRMESWSSMALSAAVLEPVRAQLHLPETVPQLASKLSVEVPPGSSILVVTATGGDEDGTVRLAGAVVSSLMHQIAATTPKQAMGSPAITVIQLQAPSQSVDSGKPSAASRAFLGALVGLVGAVLLARRVERTATSRKL